MIVDFCIREATKSDSHSIAVLTDKLCKNQLSNDKYFSRSLLFPKASEDIIVNHIENQKWCIYVAEKDSTVVGYVEAFYQPKDYYFFHDDYVYLLNMYVEKEHRSYPIMRELLGSVEAFAKNNNVKYIGADVFEHNSKIYKALEYCHYFTYRRRFIKELK